MKKIKEIIFDVFRYISSFFHDAMQRMSMVSTAKKGIAIALVAGMISAGIFGHIVTADAAKAGNFKITYWTFTLKKGNQVEPKYQISVKDVKSGKDKISDDVTQGTWTKTTSTIYYQPSGLNIPDQNISDSTSDGRKISSIQVDNMNVTTQYVNPEKAITALNKLEDEYKNKSSDFKGFFTSPDCNSNQKITGTTGGDSGYGKIASTDSNGGDSSTIDDENGNSAVDGDDDDSDDKENVDVLRLIVQDMFSMEVNNPFSEKEIKFFDLGSSAKSMLTFSQVSELKTDGNGKITEIAKNINSGIMDVAASILVFFVIFEVLSMTARESEHISWARTLMIFFKEAFFGALAYGSWKLATAFLGMGDVITSAVVGATKNAAASSEAAQTIGKALAVFIASQSPLYKAFTFIICLILWMIMIGTAIAVLVFVISRVLRILIYMALAPIPIVLCANEQTSHTGLRFIMNLFALGIEAAIIMLLCNFYILGVNGIMQSAGADSVDTMIKFLLGMIMMNSMLAGSIQASTGMSREFIGM